MPVEARFYPRPLRNPKGLGEMTAEIRAPDRLINNINDAGLIRPHRSELE